MIQRHGGRSDVLAQVESEVNSQPELLGAFLREDVGRAPRGSLFVGAGDSYEASRIAVQLAPTEHAALDPYELLSAPHLARGRSVYFVSASGNTRMNAAAAKAVQGIARETTAVTANPIGKLAAVTDVTIYIPYRVRPRTPGTVSFSLSLLALLKLTQPEIACNLRRAFDRARRDAGHALISDAGTTFILANGPAFPAGCYMGLKVNEILGAKAQCLMLEEFGHAPLFSLNPGDAVTILAAFDPLRLARRLRQTLERNGVRHAVIPRFGSNAFEEVFHVVFLSQIATIGKAKGKGHLRPYFTRATKKLAASDSLIYL